MFSPGDVILFWSDEAGKPKFHLCISLSGHFLYVNTPKPRSYPGDFIIPCSDLPFLHPTKSGYSAISCSVVLRKSEDVLRRLKAKRVGSVSPLLLRKLIEFIDHSIVLSDEDKEDALEGLGDWI